MNKVERVGWIDLAQDRDRFRAVVGKDVNCLVPHSEKNFLNG
jgi:hypothetical protein